MANLKGIREKIKNSSDYSPEFSLYDDQLDELINDAFYSIWTSKQWTFTSKASTIRTHPDMMSGTDTEHTGAALSVTAAVTHGDRKVVFSHNMDRLGKINVWEGQPISIQNQEYIISVILDDKTLLLDQAFYGKTNAVEAVWRIKKRFYALPEDCLELQYFGLRDYPYNDVTTYGKAAGILPRREETHDMRADTFAPEALAYIPTAPANIPSAESLSLVSASVAGGTMTAGFYELCWAFVKEGKISALSDPIVVEVLAANNAITGTFLGWDGTTILSDGYQSNDLSAPQWEGYRKVVFWNKNLNRANGERKGLPCWLQVINGGSTRNATAYLYQALYSDTIPTFNLLYDNQFDNGSKRYIDIDGQHQEIRPYPRINGWDYEQQWIADVQEHDYFREYVIRYYKKPQDLLLDSDSPEMPYEFHQLISFKAMEELYLKFGNPGLSNVYAARYAKEMKNLEKRYVSHSDLVIRRGQFGVSVGTRAGILYGASVKYNG